MSNVAPADLIIRKPVALLNRNLNVNWKELFISLGKIAMFSALGEAKDVWENVIDSAKTLGLAKSNEEIAWLLISKSLMQALQDLIEDYKDLFPQVLSEETVADLAERLEHTLNAVEVGLTVSFFEQPQNLALLDDFKSALVFWLKGLGLDAFQAEALHNRLRSQFVLALHREWAKHTDTYAGLIAVINTPFTQAVKQQRSRLQYNAWLEKQANERVFNEAFGLRQIYIPLRAYYRQKTAKEGQAEQRIVVDLHAAIHQWLLHFDVNDAIRVISGGPGSGKSTFSKILAADLAQAQAIPVLFVPLHYFNIYDSLLKAIEQFVNEDLILTISPLDAKEGEKRLLIIFDGLDELSMQGKAADATARDFMDEVLNTLNRYNGRDQIKWQILITGRDLAIQASETRLRNPQQIFQLLPYYLDLENYETKGRNYQDDNKLLDIDQRDSWWQKFGKAKGINYTGLPPELDKKNLTPITTEPLLNYLVALSYERKQIEFNANLSLNAVYYDLLQAVYERQYAGRHANACNLSIAEFLAILEEIALAVWHGNGRTASEAYLIERCKDAGLDNYLARYAEEAKKGVVRLLTAFYFRQFGTEKNGERTFEFTHKSFGEYLAARRIMGAVETICEERARHQQNPRQGWSIEQALMEWVKICGRSELTDYLRAFLASEIAIWYANNNQLITQWNLIINELVDYIIHNATPLEKFPNLTYLDMYQQSNSAENALFFIRQTCAVQTSVMNEITYQHEQALRNWLKRTHCSFLGNLNAELQDLTFANLSGANLSGANLAGANLAGANLAGANLSRAYLNGANLNGANLSRVSLEGVNLNRANLRGANLSRAYLNGAYLNGANLNGANLSGASLNGASLNGASLEGANLNGASLNGANLSGASLEGANLNGANLEKSNFERANLKDVNLEKANLREAVFRGANFERANFTNANLTKANFQWASLKEVILDKTTLDGAILEGSIFESKNWRAITGYTEPDEGAEEQTPTDVE
jgi:uncharacterized protein YjbI with pentapeptide repeats